MIVKVTIGDRTYQVELGDLEARPILATVEGETVEVWPDETGMSVGTPATASKAQPPSLSSPQPTPHDGKGRGEAAATIRAPIPGVIASIAVQVGAAVTVGQEICVLEAMKMKNAIRAPRAGTIAAVHVVVGQPVRHHDPLMEYRN